MGKYFDPNNQSPKAINKVTINANIITLSGTSTDGHAAYITINGIVNTTNLSYLTSVTITAAAWVLANYDFYKVRGFNVANVAGVITVTRVHGWDTTNTINATITTVAGGSTLTGTYTGTFTLDASKAKLWEVTFNTASGIVSHPANIKDGDHVEVLFVSASTTSLTSVSTVFLDGLAIPTIALTTAPYIAEGFYESVTGRLILHSTTNGIFVTGTPLVLAGATTRALSAYSTSAVATAVTLSTMTVKQTQTALSAVNSLEVAQFTLASNVKLGQWANALCAKVDLLATGYSAGIVGVVCAELDFPSGGVTGGSGQYHCFEAEMNLAGTTGGVPKSFLNMNVWGAQKAEFDTDGYIFDIQGIADHATGKVFQVNTATAASHALRIRINNEAY